jgi:hypothetical protein
MSVKVTPEIRREVIEATELCKNPKCTAHDAVVIRIWEYAHKKRDITLVREETIKEVSEKAGLGRLKYL